MSAFDKTKVWAKVLAELAESVDFGMLAILQKDTYLDSIEMDGMQQVALVGCKTWNVVEMLQRKGFHDKLERVFLDRFGLTVRVKFVIGRPRLIEKAVSPSYTEAKPADDSERAALHAQYGDIMGIVDRHPVFVQAKKPLTQGGWGIFDKKLTRACREYGPEVILTALREIANDPSVQRPRAYFDSQLKQGRWGHKLARSADMIGPQLQPV